MNTTDINARVEALRSWMKRQQLDAFIVPSTDPHNSEYPPSRWKTRGWLTGFDGSAGTAVVTAREACLWTDSRYFLQAAEQLAGTPFTLMREATEGTPTIAQWLAQRLGTDGRAGFVAETASLDQMASWRLEGLGAEQLMPQSEDPFDTLWTDRPALPCAPVEVQSLDYAGRTAAEKLQLVRQALGPNQGPAALMLSDLSETAWTLNLRGDDVEYNPLFVAYLLVKPTGATLFTDPSRVTPKARAVLDEAGVALKPYDAWREDLDQLPPETILHLPATVNMAVHAHARQLPIQSCPVTPSPVPALRAVKTEAEQEGFRRSMVRDGVALVRMLRWLDEAVWAGEEVTEVDVDRRLTTLRAEQPGFRGLSFATIAGYGPHGAIVHYEATPQSAARLRPEGLLLLDTGAHYVDGTTDITRTIALGPTTPEERRAYTLVLKGHIGLARSRFPEGTTGLQLDLAARADMWREGYDFGHGTGHGVGSRLGVHEGPQQVRKNVCPASLEPLRAGMTITDEPGIYVPGSFGVRIENVLLAVRGPVTDFGSFLEFETLTLCPIDLRPVECHLLTAAEREWLNAYHARVLATLAPQLADEADRRWLEAATRPI